jgi:uncharacterized membrane protein YqiK
MGIVMLTFVFVIVGIILSIGPWFAKDQLGMGAGSVWFLSGSGVVVLLAITAISIYTKLYRKASANMAYVKTGMGGHDVIMDAGRVIFPIVHQIIPVSLETMRLNVERRGAHALITKDNLRVDLNAEFYIKVRANHDDILQAARSLGSRNVQAEGVSELVQEKLVSALRTVAATKDLVELHAKRDEFASAVQQIVIHDLAHNGLTLESVTISSLDQTDPTQLQDRNVFDAQGLRKIAEITQKARVERNEIEQESQKQVTQKNVATRKQVLDMERDQAEFEAEQKAKVANVRAERERQIAAFKIEQDEAVSKRDIEKMKNIETAEVERTLTVEQANIAKQTALIAKQKEQETANILKKQAIEVAERAKEVAVAEKERERAEAQASVLSAEAEREKAKQSVVTVQVTSEAEREAQKKLIAAQNEAKQKQVRDQTEADVKAYTQVKQADGERQAAQMQYEARLRLAEANSQAAAKQAEGERAVKMVDVNVERERVNVEQARVEVERQSLSNRSEFEEAALKFELEKLRIQADKEVRIAAAAALGNMLAKAQMQIFGDPSTMAKMSEQFMRAASLGNAADGLLKTLPPEGQDLLAKIASGVMTSLTPAKPVESTPVAGAGNGAHGNQPAAPVGLASAEVKSGSEVKLPKDRK